MHLGELTRPDLIFPDLAGSDTPTILRSLADRLATHGLVEDADKLYRRLFEREELCSTAIGGGVAIPHCKVDNLDRVALAIGISDRDVEFGAVDKQPVRLFFLIVSPADDPAAHLKALATVSKWLKAGNHTARITGLQDASAIYDLLQAEYA